MAFCSSCAFPEPGPLPSSGFHRLQRYYWPIRRPRRPSLLLTERQLPTRTSIPLGFPVLLVFSSCTHAVANTPVGPSGASLSVSRRRRPSLFLARSAPTSPVSWPAQRSLTLRPACSLTPNRGLFSGCFSPSRYLLEPLRVLPAGAKVAGRDSHPLEMTRLFTAHEKCGLGDGRERA